MKSKLLTGTALVALAALSWLGGSMTRAQQGQPTSQQSEAAQVNEFFAKQQQTERDFKDPQFFSPESTPRWPLVGALQRYSSIKAEKLLEYVKEQVDLSYKSRDQGDQLWGRITGTQIDAEDAAWFMSTLRKIGVTDVHQEMLDLPPQATTTYCLPPTS